MGCSLQRSSLSISSSGKTQQMSPNTKRMGGHTHLRQWLPVRASVELIWVLGRWGTHQWWPSGGFYLVGAQIQFATKSISCQHWVSSLRLIYGENTVGWVQEKSFSLDRLTPGKSHSWNLSWHLKSPCSATRSRRIPQTVHRSLQWHQFHCQIFACFQL